MHEEPLINTRNSFMGYSETYFWTSTINNWNHLLANDEFKLIIIQSLQWLCERKLIALYGYVIMPNHVHFIWEQLKNNGKENPKGSFGKYTAHQFRTRLMKNNSGALTAFQVNTNDRRYSFWQRDPLAIQIKDRDMAWQKLEYIHSNPLQEHWNLCDDPLKYRFSSAQFYENCLDEFGILTHIMDRY